MATTQQQRDEYLGLVVAGWILAFYLPVGGLICGFFLVNRRDGHAFGIVGVSVLAVLAYVFLVVIPLLN